MLHCPPGHPIFIDIEVWAHIEEKHLEIASYEEINLALRDPGLIHRFENDSTLQVYYRLVENGPRNFRGLYLTVVVRSETVGADDLVEGIVRTACLERKPNAKGVIEWMPST